jgi:hypothetical protein
MDKASLERFGHILGMSGVCAHQDIKVALLHDD